MQPMIRFLRRFHHEEEAQVTFLGVAGCVCFVALLSMVINSNDVITERVHMQDVADATVLSAASWNARGFNLVSFVNVMNTKLISTAVLLNALADALPVIEAVGQVQLAIFQGCSGVPIVGAFCAAMAVVVRIQLAVLKPLRQAVTKLANKLSRCNGSAGLWKTMTGLQKLGDGVQVSFPAAAIAESVAIARANGASFGLVLNGKLENSFKLPIKKGEFNDFCPKMKNGGPGFELQGYKCNQGPLKLGQARINRTLLLPFTNLVAQPIFIGMVAAHNAQVGCVNDPEDENTKIPVKLRNLDECRSKNKNSRWSHLFAQTRELDDPNLTLNDFIPWKPRRDHGDGGGDKPNQGQIEDQLGDINITPDPEGGGAGPGAVKPGPGNELIPPQNEIKVPSVAADLKLSCRGDVYPTYQPTTIDAQGGAHIDPVWDSNRSGRSFSTKSLCNLLGGGNTLGISLHCKRVDEWSEFTWFSGKHQRGGPETIGGYFIRVQRRDIEPPEGEQGPTKYVYVVETITLIDAGEVKMDQKEFREYLNSQGQDVDTEASQSSSGCKKPQPWLLDRGTSESAKKEFADRLRYIGLVYKDSGTDRPFWSNFYDDPPPRTIAYAQAEVYNHLSEDTFTQDWRVRLQQATLLDSFLKSGKASGMGALGGNTGLIGAVNNH